MARKRKAAGGAAPDASPRLSPVAIRGWLTKHFFLRVHMTLIVASTIGAGIAATNFLTLMDVNVLAVRYAVAVAAAYCAFLALVRLWLWYVGIQTARASQRSSVDIDGRGIDITDFNIGNFLGDLRPGGSSLTTGGGHFGGGGATGSWGDAPVSAGSSSGKSGGGGGFDLDLGDDAGAIVLVILIVIAVAIAAVAAFYLIYAAPAILSETAFEAVLAAAVARKTKQMSNMGWIGAVSKKTFWPFAAVMAATIAVGWFAQYHCPEARTLVQALHCSEYFK
jgi:hypothetical protein